MAHRRQGREEGGEREKQYGEGGRHRGRTVKRGRGRERGREVEGERVRRGGAGLVPITGWLGSRQGNLTLATQYSYQSTHKTAERACVSRGCTGEQTVLTERQADQTDRTTVCAYVCVCVCVCVCVREQVHVLFKK